MKGEILHSFILSSINFDLFFRQTSHNSFQAQEPTSDPDGNFNLMNFKIMMDTLGKERQRLAAMTKVEKQISLILINCFVLKESSGMAGAGNLLKYVQGKYSSSGILFFY